MATTMTERPGIITMKGNPRTLVGPELHSGDAAPDFALSAADLSVKHLDDVVGGGKNAALLIVVPSLDTNVCSIESHKFNDRIAELPEGVKAYVVSMDLPFAQTRWKGDGDEIQLGLLSDYRERSFGPAYGVLIKEMGLLARSIFVIGADKTIRYVQIVPEISAEPDYDAAIDAAVAAA